MRSISTLLNNSLHNNVHLPVYNSINDLTRQYVNNLITRPVRDALIGSVRNNIKP